jgi:uncharacterized FlaG/YvyC family protein
MNSVVTNTSASTATALTYYGAAQQNNSSAKTASTAAAKKPVTKTDTPLKSSKDVKENLVLLNTRNDTNRTVKQTNISKNEKTGDVVVKFFDLEGNKVNQYPPEQYLKTKELNSVIRGSVVDILV